MENYYDTLHNLLNKKVKVIIDRRINSIHPKHKNIKYETNYGYIEDLIAPDGEYQDAYVLCFDENIEYFIGDVIAIVHRFDDNEDKLIVANKNYTDEEIKKMINFQEKYFKYEIIRK